LPDNDLNIKPVIIKKLITLLTVSVVCLLLFSVCRDLIAQDEFLIVESVPDETVFIESDLNRTLDIWLNIIKNAESSIDIETFYFADEENEPLQSVLGELVNASDRGVKIRIIVDSTFYAKNDKSVDKLEGNINIQIRKIPFGNIAGGVMHAKYFVADNETVFLGSQNFDWRALIHIHELGVKIKNKKLASVFTSLFNADWNLCEGISDFNKPDYIVNSENPLNLMTDNFGMIKIYPAFSPAGFIFPEMNYEETELIKIIENTAKSLFIQIYSYSPSSKIEGFSYLKIDSALRNAAGRGVEVNLIFPDWAIREKSTDFIKELSIVENINVKFISIPQHSKGFIPYSRVDHCKYFLSDDIVTWISTANWEWSYFNNSRNCTLIIENEKVNKKLKEVFFRSWNSPYSEFIDVEKTYEPVKRY